MLLNVQYLPKHDSEAQCFISLGLGTSCLFIATPTATGLYFHSSNRMRFVVLTVIQIGTGIGSVLYPYLLRYLAWVRFNLVFALFLFVIYGLMQIGHYFCYIWDVNYHSQYNDVKRTRTLPPCTKEFNIATKVACPNSTSKLANCMRSIVFL